MGMFDTFHIDDGRSIQTKDLDCTMENFSIGDTVPDYPGNFDGPTGNFYITRDTFSVFVIGNIYVNFFECDDPDELKTVTRDIFKTYLTNFEFTANRYAHVIKKYINPIYNLRASQRAKALAVLRDYEFYKNFNDNPNNRKNMVKFVHRYFERFENGELLETILNEVLTENYESTEQTDYE